MSTKTLERPLSNPPAGAGLSHDVIHERSALLRDMIEKQELARASAMLDGHVFNSADLHAAEEELAALAGADSELTRRKRAEAALVARGERADRVACVQAVTEAWIAGIDDQEAAARAFIAALKQTEVARAELQGLVQQLLGSVPTLLFVTEQENRRSNGLCALLNQCTQTGRFGEVDLLFGMTDANAPWSLAERRMTETIIPQLNEAPIVEAP